MISRFLYALRWLLFPAGLAGATWFLLEILDTNSLAWESLPVGWLLVSFAISLGYVVICGVLWHGVTKLYSANIPIHDAVSIYMASNVGKYVPLKIMGLSYRVVTYSQRYKKSSSIIAMACVTETLAVLIGGLTLSLVLGYVTPGLGLRIDWWIHLMIGATLFALFLPVVHRSLISQVARLYDFAQLEDTISPWKLFLAVFKYAGAWLVFGLSIFVICAGFGLTITVGIYLQVTAISIVAGMAGILVFIVPSGIGVREGVMFFGLSNLLPSAEAGLVVLLARAIVTSAEVIAAMSAIGFLELLSQPSDQHNS